MVIIKWHLLLRKVLQILEMRLKLCQKVKKNPEETKILNIVIDIFGFALNERKTGHGLKILIPNQMFSRLPITLGSIKSRK